MPSALAATMTCVLLVGCSSGADTSSAPGGEATSVQPTSSGIPRSASPSSNGSDVPPSATNSAAADFCATLLADQKAAADAVAKAIRRPSSEGITMQDLQGARAKLQADVLLAPPDLQAQVRAQVATIDDLIQRLQTGSIKGLSPRPFNDAQKKLQQFCSEGG